ncbi:P-loop containing nucleoside triphosphate hydrolase protein [Poronia punctata]|nr:P-loop containing nucleoside triphosphate hydrolase protein [Poronia punctata]
MQDNMENNQDIPIAVQDMMSERFDYVDSQLGVIRAAVTKSQQVENDLPTALSDAVTGKIGEFTEVLSLLSDRIEAGESALQEQLLEQLKGMTDSYGTLTGDIEQMIERKNRDKYVQTVNNSEEFKRQLERHYSRDTLLLQAISGIHVKLDMMDIRNRDSAQPEAVRDRSNTHSSTQSGARSGTSSGSGLSSETQLTAVSNNESELIAAREEIQRLKNALGGSVDLHEEYSLAQKTIAFLKAEKQKDELARKSYLVRYHSLVQELADYKGNVRVMCRIKPEDAPEEELINFMNPEGDHSFLPWSQLALVTKEDNIRTETRSFNFQKVFGSGEDNPTIFNEVKDFALSATLGRSATIIGYGATGSGKSHTFLSSDGLVPSYLDFLFQLEFEESVHHLYVFSLSVVEIYLDKVTDLLPNPTEDEEEGSSSSAPAIHVLENREMALALLQRAVNERKVAENGRNKMSSRSHFVASIKIIRKPVDGMSKEKATEGVINFVDLAGSEPVGRNLKATSAGNNATQELIATQGQDINSSLLELGQAIRNLNKKQVFFGKHSLTKFLRQSLSLESRVLVLVTVSSLKANLGNTLSTLLWSQESSPDEGCALTKKQTTSPVASKLPRTRPTSIMGALPPPKASTGSETPRRRPVSMLVPKGRRMPVPESNPAPVQEVNPALRPTPTAAKRRSMALPAPNTPKGLALQRRRIALPAPDAVRGTVPKSPNFTRGRLPPRDQ